MKKRLLFFLVFLVSISAYSQCPVNILSVDPLTCNGPQSGNQDGSITASSSTAGYWTYTLQIWNSTANMWMPFGTINTGNPSYTFTNLPSDSFRVSVEDTLISTPPTGCLSVVVFVSQPDSLISNSSSADESAPGACDGSINVTVSGGTTPYNFSWTGPSGYTSSNQNINSLCAGNYSLSITDVNGCFSDTTFFEVTNIVSSIHNVNINDLLVSPNPSKNIFNITFSSTTNSDIKIKIVNLIGKIVFIENLQQFNGEYSNQINLQENSKGVYFLEIETERGAINKKLILQ